MRHNESTLQCQCVRWFRYQYPRFTLFAIPNGGNRDAVTGAIMKKEGVLAGVADLFLMLANHGYHGLFIEMKTSEGRQADSQKMFQFQCEAFGYKYEICRSLEEFISTINEYLEDTNNETDQI